MTVADTGHHQTFCISANDDVLHHRRSHPLTAIVTILFNVAETDGSAKREILASTVNLRLCGRNHATHCARSTIANVIIHFADSAPYTQPASTPSSFPHATACLQRTCRPWTWGTLPLTHGHARPAAPVTIRQRGRRLNDDPAGYTFTPSERATTRSPGTHSTAMQTKSRMNSAETTQITG